MTNRIVDMYTISQSFKCIKDYSAYAQFSSYHGDCTQQPNRLPILTDTLAGQLRRQNWSIENCEVRGVPTLSYGHELWAVAKKMRSRIPAAKTSFLRRVAGLRLRDRVRSSDIWRELGVELLLPCADSSQLRWFRHLTRVPLGPLPLEVFFPGMSNW